MYNAYGVSNAQEYYYTTSNIMKQNISFVFLLGKAESLSADSEAHLRGGFAAIRLYDDPNDDTNLNCSSNSRCTYNEYCYNNGVCYNNYKCNNRGINPGDRPISHF